MATCQGDPHWRFHAVPKGTPNWPTLTDEQRCWAERHFNVDHKIMARWLPVFNLPRQWTASEYGGDEPLPKLGFRLRLVH